MLAIAAAVAAFAADPTADATGAVLLVYGPLGLFAALALVAFRVIWKRANELFGATTDRCVAAEAKYAVLVDKLVADVVPALVRSTDAITDVLAELRRRDGR
jgi:hypothetical protein